jgi:hypothetical protein
MLRICYAHGLGSQALKCNICANGLRTLKNGHDSTGDPGGCIRGVETHTHTRLRSLDQARWAVQYKPQAVIHTHDVTQGRLGWLIHKRAHEWTN